MEQDAFNTLARKLGRGDTRQDHATVVAFIAGKNDGLDVKIAEREYKLGAVAEWAKLKGLVKTDASADQWALTCAGKAKPPTTGERTDKHRTPEEHNAWSSAGMRISRILRKAGVTEVAAPRAKTTNEVRTPSEVNSTSAEPRALTALAAPRVTGPQDWKTVAIDYAASMLRCMNEAAKEMTGDEGAHFRAMVTDWQNGVNEFPSN